MNALNNRDEVISFVNMNFGYLSSIGFQIIEVDMPNTMSWAVIFEGKCRLRIEWNWHDGVFIYASKSGKIDSKIPRGYAVEILVYYLLGKEVVEKYFDETNMGNGLENINPYSFFLQAHLDKIMEFVSSNEYESQIPQVQQSRQALLDLQIQRIEKPDLGGAKK